MLSLRDGAPPSGTSRPRRKPYFSGPRPPLRLVSAESVGEGWVLEYGFIPNPASKASG